MSLRPKKAHVAVSLLGVKGHNYFYQSTIEGLSILIYNGFWFNLYIRVSEDD